MPDQSPACAARLDAFFGQWFDTAFRPAAESTVRSSPVRGLAGPGFYDATGGCIGPPADGAMAAPSASAAIGSGGLDVGDGRVQRGVG
jgi:hypothetical protein